MNKSRTKLMKGLWLCAVGCCRLMVPEGSSRPAVLLGVLLAAAGNVMAQTTAFTYQGSLTDNGNGANGQYDFQFRLFDTAIPGTGTQQGSTLTVPDVQVTSGTFTAQIDFGSVVFDGSPRFLEIGIRPAGSPNPFTVLSPRQPVTSTPYSVRSIRADIADTATNATQLGGLSPGGFVQNTTAQQAGVNFNIGGTGTANILDAATQFNLGGSRILSNAGQQNLFAGVGTGASNTTGAANSFFGHNAGLTNTTACCNAFFGTEAGLNNTGPGNTFFGSTAGRSNTTANQNSFFGAFAGFSNTTGAFNSFFGYVAGELNTTGGSNSFFGRQAGLGNTTGANNTIIGADANVGSGNLNFATALGAGALVGTSHTIVLGTNAETTRIPGLMSVGGQPGFNPILEIANSNNGGALIANNLYIRQFTEPASSAPLCWRASTIGVPAFVVTNCSSSVRYKTDLQPYSGGLGVIRRLKPITFTWKATSERDIGLIAEEVAEVEPLFTFKNSKGDIEGVKYPNLSVLFINAFKEQQAQIDAQKERLKRQQQQIDALKQLVCTDRPQADACK